MFVHCPQPGLVDLRTEEGNGQRLYVTPDGRRYPSVTTVLKLHSEEGINAWRKRVGDEEADRVMKRASGRGTRLHDHLEHTLRNTVVTPGLLDREMYESMLPAVRRINNIRMLEQALYSDHLQMAGRVDCIGEFDGKLSVIDFKTSTKLKEVDWVTGYFMQVAGYAVMYEERTGISIPQGVVIIGVDFDQPQVYTVRRDAWIKQLIAYRKQWGLRMNHGII